MAAAADNVTARTIGVNSQSGEISASTNAVDPIFGLPDQLQGDENQADR